MEAVKNDGDALLYASEVLQGDREIVMEAVKKDGNAMQFAAEELQADREIVIEAVKQNENAIYYSLLGPRYDKHSIQLACYYWNKNRIGRIKNS